MNRCLIPAQSRQPARRLAIGLLICLSALPTLAAAQGTPGLQRQFPARSELGTLVVTAPPEVLLDGKAARLSPGARIRGLSNAIVMSASLVNQPLPIRYQRDPQGMIHEAWILSDAEAEQQRALEAAKLR